MVYFHLPCLSFTIHFYKALLHVSISFKLYADELNILQVASKVIGEVQALIIFPIVPYLLLAVFYMIWFSATLHLFSSGEVEQNACSSNCCTYDLGSNRVSCDHCCGYRIKYTSHLGLAIAFHLLGCYWATQFLKAFSSTVIAGSVASYYWARGEALVRVYNCCN